MMLRRRATEESGLALIAVFLAMALLTAVGLALTAVGSIDLRSVHDHRSATDAVLVADAGATHALALMSSCGSRKPSSQTRQSQIA